MKNLSKSFKSGFTLIELLVVVAIIGILASVVLASLNSARDKGKDASAIASMSSIRSSAEIFYSGAVGNSTYTGVCADADVVKLRDAAEAQIGGTTVSVCNVVATTGAGYAASIPLLETGQYFCVDSTGVAGKTATALGAATVCTIN